MSRIRLDKLLVKRKMADDIASATELISSGAILVNGASQSSPASFVDSGSAIELVPEAKKYVSRGGFKLVHALDAFSISPKNKRCLDVGASTGGFTDCLLQSGAMHVVAVDVGKGQLDDSIRHHADVTIFEKLNAKGLNPELIGGSCELAVIDVSFTSVVPLLPAIINCLEPVEIIALIKPQFEVGQSDINNQGIVTSAQVHESCIQEFRDAIAPELVMTALEFSPITGAKGNIEFLGHLVASSTNAESVSNSRINECIQSAHATLRKPHD